MPVELIMTQGSNAGTVAPIHTGYYLVGRHQECQIRPKSRSVSRRHCLLMRNEDGFGALDLKSTRGTFVNGTRIDPHKWRVLCDGDQIRFGKVAFSVSIKRPTFVTVGKRDSATSDSDRPNPGELETPESWENFEVAEFLEDEDHDTLIGNASENVSDDDASERIVEVDSVSKKRPPRRKIDHKEYKRAPKRSIKLPTFGSSGAGVDWKLVGTVTAVSMAVGLLVFQVHRIQSGPGIEVRQNLD